MEMTGSRAVPAPTERVWHALNDPETLKSCIPGCESIVSDGENAYTMVMAAKVGPVSARFTGKMRLADIDAPRAYTLRFEGSGGPAGFVKGEGRVTLEANGAGATTLNYTAKAQIGGKLAQIGSRLIDGAAQKLTEEFFTCFVAALSPPVAEPVGATAVADVSSPKPRMMYAVGAVVIVAALAILYFVTRSS